MNPFRIEALQPDQPFCDRQEELGRLTEHALSFRNVLLSSPRRYGKTSLALRVQDRLRRQGWVCIRADFFGVDSVEDVARRIGRGLIRALDDRESLMGKGVRFLKGLRGFRPVFMPDENGISLSVQRVPETINPIELLTNTLDDLSRIAARKEFKLHVAFDEFQEITRLEESGEIEGLIREAIQGQEASYLFLGSRRGVLRAIFNERKRPLFQSTINMTLDPLPERDSATFLQERFAGGRKPISAEDAAYLWGLVAGYPYYVQRLATEVYHIAAKEVTRQDIDQAMKSMIAGERYGYQAILSGMTPRQVRILKSIALHPVAELQGTQFITLSGAPLSSIGQTARKLLAEDLIEKGEDGIWRVVDPVFSLWLREM